jgi:hypothetical protein
MGIERLLMFLTFIVLVCSVSGCATLYLQTSLRINPTAASYLEELQKIDKCSYQGQETIQKITYARLHLTGESKAPPNILLPLGANSYVKSIWRQPPDSEIPSNHSVTCIYNPPIDKGIKTLAPLLPPESWQGYPATVIIFNHKNEERIYIAYRRSPKEDDIHLSIADASDLNLKSTELRRTILSTVLLPITIAVDIVTWPVQTAIFIAAYSVTGKSGANNLL